MIITYKKIYWEDEIEENRCQLEGSFEKLKQKDYCCDDLYMFSGGHSLDIGRGQIGPSVYFNLKDRYDDTEYVYIRFCPFCGQEIQLQCEGEYQRITKQVEKMTKVTESHLKKIGGKK